MQVPIRKSEKRVTTKPDNCITRQKYNDIKAKLERMLNITRPPAIEEVARLAQLGDFSENAEYQLAKGKLRGLNRRIDEMQYLIDHADIIEPSGNKDSVDVGHFVTVESASERKTYQILGSNETDPQRGIISRNSPLGVALLGKRIGEVISIQLGGKPKTFTVLDIT